MDMTSSVVSELKPCSTCGRTFRPEALERHHNVCKKQAEKKRKIFDSKKQRAVEVDGVEKPIPKPEPKANTVKKPAKKGNWREKHEDLIRTIRRSREGNKKSDNPSDQVEEKRVPSDYVQCPGCNRHFNERAAERHIPWCQKKQKETLKTPPAAGEAKEKLIARIKYKVPPPSRSKKSAPKPKTAGPTVARVEEPQPQVDREKSSYSSPPSCLDNRNKNIQAYKSQYAPRKRDCRNGSRSSPEIKSSYSPDSYHSIKFKEKFPNHVNKRDLEESLSAEQLQELLRCSRLIDSRCPKTVPGVRLTGPKSNNWISAWNKESFDSSALPEVSSSELPDSWMGKLGWIRDFDASVGSSGGSSSSSSSNSSLPPTSRESGSDVQLLFYCHQCHHKFPLVGAKYCCECGAKRRGIGTVGQSV